MDHRYNYRIQEPDTYGTVFSNYGDNATSDYGQNIRRLITNEGYTGEHALSIGGNYSNKVFRSHPGYQQIEIYRTL